jgi:membrane associated rhomboid family serine protease
MRYVDPIVNYNKNMRVVWSFIAVNAGVFLTWQYATSTRPPNIKLYRWLQVNTLTSIAHIKNNKWWTVVTSSFSHISLMHFAFNMISFHAFASYLATVPAVRPFHLVSIIFGSSIATSLGFYEHAQRERSPQRRALGASGVVMGTGAVAAVLRPRAIFLLYGIVPVPLALLVGGYFAIDTFYLDDKTSNIGHAGHIGGATFGFLYAFVKYKLRKT